MLKIVTNGVGTCRACKRGFGVFFTASIDPLYQFLTMMM